MPYPQALTARRLPQVLYPLQTPLHPTHRLTAPSSVLASPSLLIKVGELKSGKIVSFNRLNRERRAAIDTLCEAFQDQAAKNLAD